ncbi:hypothetical protein RI367_000340 [Sorochytrium milnesiophthora]
MHAQTRCSGVDRLLLVFALTCAFSLCLLPSIASASFVDVTSRVRLEFSNNTAQSLDKELSSRVPRSILYNLLGHVMLFGEAGVCGSDQRRGVVVSVFEPTVSQQDALYEQSVCDGSADVYLLDTALDPTNATVYFAYKVDETPPFINLDKMDASDGTIDNIASFNWTDGQPLSLAVSPSDSGDGVKIFVSQNEVSWVYEDGNIDVALMYNPGITVLSTRTAEGSVFFMLRDDSDGSLYLRRQKALNSTQDGEMDVDLSTKAPYTFFQPHLPSYLTQEPDQMLQKPMLLCGDNLYVIMQRAHPSHTEYMFMSFGTSDMQNIAVGNETVPKDTVLLSATCDMASRDGSLLLLLQRNSTSSSNNNNNPEALWSLNNQLQVTSQAHFSPVVRHVALDTSKSDGSNGAAALQSSSSAGSSVAASSGESLSKATQTLTFKRIKVLSSPTGDLSTLLYAPSSIGQQGRGYLAAQVYVDCRRSPSDPRAVKVTAFVCIQCSYAGAAGATIVYPTLPSAAAPSSDNGLYPVVPSNQSALSTGGAAASTDPNNPQSGSQCLTLMNAAGRGSAVTGAATSPTTTGDISSLCPAPYYYDTKTGQCRFCTGEATDDVCRSMAGARQDATTVVNDPMRVTLGVVGCVAGLVGLLAGISLHQRGKALTSIPSLLERGLQAMSMGKNTDKPPALLRHTSYGQEQMDQLESPTQNTHRLTTTTETHRLPTQYTTTIDVSTCGACVPDESASEHVSDCELSQGLQAAAAPQEDTTNINHLQNNTTFYAGLFAEKYLRDRQRSVLLFESAATSFDSVELVDESVDMRKQHHRRSRSIGASKLTSLFHAREVTPPTGRKGFTLPRGINAGSTMSPATQASGESQQARSAMLNTIVSATLRRAHQQMQQQPVAEPSEPHLTTPKKVADIRPAHESRRDSDAVSHQDVSQISEVAATRSLNLSPVNKRSSTACASFSFDMSHILPCDISVASAQSIYSDDGSSHIKRRSAARASMLIKPLHTSIPMSFGEDEDEISLISPMVSKLPGNQPLSSTPPPISPSEPPPRPLLKRPLSERPLSRRH